jgi:hypothetical protein
MRDAIVNPFYPDYFACENRKLHCSRKNNLSNLYLCLFGTGKLLLHQPAMGFTLLTLSAISALALYRNFVASFSQEPDTSAKTPAAG